MILEDVLAYDALDPLRDKRDLFNIPEGVIYLDGNSLGVQPKATPDAMHNMPSMLTGFDSFFDY